MTLINGIPCNRDDKRLKERKIKTENDEKRVYMHNIESDSMVKQLTTVKQKEKKKKTDFESDVPPLKIRN